MLNYEIRKGVCTNSCSTVNNKEDTINKAHRKEDTTSKAHHREDIINNNHNQCTFNNRRKMMDVAEDVVDPVVLDVVELFVVSSAVKH